MDKLIEIDGLRTYFKTEAGLVHAVDGVTFSVGKGETLALVGESGCGKSVTALSILRLIPTPPGEYAGGRILYNGVDLLKATDAEMRRIRGNDIAMVFQEPMTCLNPVFTIGNQITETIMVHRHLTKSLAMDRAKEMLELVGIPDPVRRLSEYPHQLSGGLRQRVMIAMALSCNPKLLIADEPTTALDVTIQAQILELLRRLKREIGMALLIITHDLGVVAEVAERVVVMYAGQVVETGKVKDVFRKPLHPYTEGLLNCIPRMTGDRKKLVVIEGMVPSLTRVPEGCRFAPRCSYATRECVEIAPGLATEGDRSVACHYSPDERRFARQVI